MTSAVAIETLRANYPDACYEQLREAVDAAIEALKAQDAAGDTISRKAAIGAICSACGKIDCDQTDTCEKLKFPPAQPEERTEERTETHGVCLDAIDRQAVIDTVRKIILGFFSDEDDVMNDTEKTLLSVNKAVCNGVRELPHAPSRPHDISKAKFSCPICGAEMEVTVDEWDEGGER